MQLLADRDSNEIAVLLYWDQAATNDHDVVIEYRDDCRLPLPTEPPRGAPEVYESFFTLL